MTKEEIIMRGKQLGFPCLSKKSHDNQATMIATIVSEAVRLEREACLQIADDCAEADMHASVAANCIRARGQK